ncbi:MAG TPA: GNAT family N-acetyltransferase [Mesorhizobium sp.]|jgi:GNAT superfamily N-acetyltransferase|uniref:GNAT family N-acetyltransferase n=1 Tax=Mesorhizobium sp. TaxID=1871066 RepID=UPI002DDD0E19|nr:GNAT family N-acetyltransferase [Mesorhizobium sp.]HEV2502087.1 GNAT family N-acetyltransferase [Mesorhizobium sp.]
MSTVIRMMGQSDLVPLAALRHATFFVDGEHTREADVVALAGLVDGDGFEAGFVAEIDGELAGSCLFVREEIEPLHDLSPWLAGLVVAEPYRGRGLGRTLVEAVETHARSVNCNVLYLYTDAAEALYARLGWTTVERMIIDGAPLVLMQRKF